MNLIKEEPSVALERTPMSLRKQLQLLPLFAIIELIEQEKIHLLSNRSQEKRDY